MAFRCMTASMWTRMTKSLGKSVYTASKIIFEEWIWGTRQRRKKRNNIDDDDDDIIRYARQQEREYSGGEDNRRRVFQFELLDYQLRLQLQAVVGQRVRRHHVDIDRDQLRLLDL